MPLLWKKDWQMRKMQKTEQGVCLRVRVKGALILKTMGKAVLIYSLKPESPETNLNAIVEQIKKIPHFDNLEIKPFMFGMNQIFVTFVMNDKVQTTGLEEIEKKLHELRGVGSINQEAMTLV